MIMIGHISGTMGTRYFTPLAGTGVSLFLFVSGFGLNESFKKNGLSRFWRKKIKRVLIPYFFVYLAICICHKKYDLYAFVLNVTGLKTLYWYIAYLMKWYILFYVFTRWIPRYRIWFLFCSAIVMLLTLPSLEAAQVVCFPLGVLASEYIMKVLSLTRHNMIIIAIITFLLGTAALAIKQLPVMRTNMETTSYYMVQLGINAFYMISIVATLALYPLLTKSRFLLYTGAISYELYLLHFPFYGSLDGSLLYALTLLIGAYFAATLYQKFINKVTRVIPI